MASTRQTRRREMAPVKVTKPRNSGKTTYPHFLPPGCRVLDLDGVEPDDGAENHTYFLSCGSAGLRQYDRQLTAYYHRAGRAVVLASPAFAPKAGGSAVRSVRIVARLCGDFFETAKQWVESNVLSEHHEVYLETGGGTPQQRRSAVVAYWAARKRLAAHDVRRLQILSSLHQAADDMVLKNGAQPVSMGPEGAEVIWDPTHTRERIYWRPRQRVDESEEGEP